MRVGRRRGTVVAVLVVIALTGRCNAARQQEQLANGLTNDAAAPVPVQPAEDLPPCERAQRALTGANSLITYGLAHPMAAPTTEVEVAVEDLSLVMPAAPQPVAADLRTLIGAFASYVGAHDGDPDPAELGERLRELAPTYRSEEYHAARDRAATWLQDDCSV